MYGHLSADFSKKLENKSLKTHLSFQIKLWFSVEGEKQLVPLESLTLSVDKIKEMRESLDQFLQESVVNSAKICYVYDTF